MWYFSMMSRLFVKKNDCSNSCGLISVIIWFDQGNFPWIPMSLISLWYTCQKLVSLIFFLLFVDKIATVDVQLLIMKLVLKLRIWVLSQYKDHLSMYGDFHYKDKMVMRLSYLYNGNTYTGKTSLYWDGPLIIDFPGIHTRLVWDFCS